MSDSGKKFADHPFLRSELYEKCPACKGTRVTQVPAMVDGLQLTPGGARYSGPLPAGRPCPMCDGDTPGFIKTGLTVGQVERFRAQLDVLKEFVSAVANFGPNKRGETWSDEARAVLARAGIKTPLPPGGSKSSGEGVRDDIGKGNPPQDG